MSKYQLFYLLLLSASLLASVCGWKSHKSMYIFPYLLGISLLVEVCVDIMYFLLDMKKEYNIIYHFYIPVEYAILAYFFYLNIPGKKVRNWIAFSVPLFLLASICLSAYAVPVTEHPGLNFNLSGILLIIWSLVALLNIQPVMNFSIGAMPIFWISVGVLVFHSGIFFFNSTFTHIQVRNYLLAQELFTLIIKGLNYFLYICFIVAFLCSQRMKKYILP
jgi:hypothetical protein